MEEWLKQVKDNWNKTADSDWYKSLRTLQIYAHTFQAAQIRAMDTVASAISMKKASNE